MFNKRRQLPELHLGFAFVRRVVTSDIITVTATSGKLGRWPSTTTGSQISETK